MATAYLMVGSVLFANEGTIMHAARLMSAQRHAPVRLFDRLPVGVGAHFLDSDPRRLARLLRSVRIGELTAPGHQEPDENPDHRDTRPGCLPRVIASRCLLIPVPPLVSVL